MEFWNIRIFWFNNWIIIISLWYFCGVVGEWQSQLLQGEVSSILALEVFWVVLWFIEALINYYYFCVGDMDFSIILLKELDKGPAVKNPKDNSIINRIKVIGFPMDQGIVLVGQHTRPHNELKLIVSV